MDTASYQEQQEAKQLQGRISSFIGDFQIGTLLNTSGIRKLRGVSAEDMIMAMIEAIMGAAVAFLQTSRRFGMNNILFSTCWDKSES